MLVTAGGVKEIKLTYRLYGEKENGMSKLYIAYGSNLSVEQMAYRCPGAKIAGIGELEDWRLAFGRHATIEPCRGSRVPVVVWMIDDKDERSLDRYEGCPKYYYKDELAVTITDFEGENPIEVMGMVYIMTELQKNGYPSADYYYTIRASYEFFHFDTDMLEKAVNESIERAFGRKGA